MKKIMFFAAAALAMTLGACGGKSGAAAQGEDNAEQKSQWVTYTNDNYGYSVEVPGDMFKRETLTEDNGTIYSYDGEEGFTLNRVDITGSESMFVEEYTPELVQEEFEEWTNEKELASKECGDNYYTYTIVSDDLTEIDYVLFKGAKRLTVVICYDKDHEKQLGGDVAEHIIKSMQFK